MSSTNNVSQAFSQLSILKDQGDSSLASHGIAETDENKRPPQHDLPWYHSPGSMHPYQLCGVSQSAAESSTTFCCASFFPWQDASISTLWGGIEHLTLQVGQAQAQRWNAVVAAWQGVFSVCGGQKVRLFQIKANKLLEPLFTIQLDDWSEGLHAVVWSLDPNSLSPLLVFGGDQSILYIYDLELRLMRGSIKGHGNAITSLSVQPTSPQVVVSTSCDHTSRVYDITYSPTDLFDPGWPSAGIAKKGQPKFQASPAFGASIPSNLLKPKAHQKHLESGMCMAVFRGGAGIPQTSGGHSAAVLGCDFHPNLPLVVTSGADCSVKIWLLPSLPSHFKTKIALDMSDKPLFSCSTIHSSPVQAVYWITSTILVSLSSGEHPEIVLWQWLSFDRFFPSSQAENSKLGASVSDFGNSRSYKVLSRFSIHSTIRSLSIHRQPTNRPTNPSKCTTTLLTLLLSGTSQVVVLSPSLLCPCDPLQESNPSEVLDCQPQWVLSLIPPGEGGNDFEHSTMSPGGASWIVCVGRYEMVSVWGWT